MEDVARHRQDQWTKNLTVVGVGGHLRLILLFRDFIF